MKERNLPSYLRIRNELKIKIEEGELQVDDRLPSESIMAKRFNVSRETFRSAVKLLQEDGYLHVKHGVGTFVSKSLPKIPNNLSELTSITAMIKEAGLMEDELRASLRIVSCKKEWAEKLDVPIESPVVLHERIRTADGEPVAYSINIMPHQFMKESIQEQEKIGSLIKYLKVAEGVEITKADSEIVVPLPTDFYCQKLLVKPDSTILLMKQIHYDHSNFPVLYSLDYLRNDIFSFWIRRTMHD